MVMVVSEQIAFGSHISQYVVLDNHDLVEITWDEFKSKPVYSKDINSYQIKTKSAHSFDLKPDPYKFWMEKEIREQSSCVLRALNNGGRISSATTVKLGGLDGSKQALQELDHLILLGCGTSYNAGLWALSLYKSLDIFDTVGIYDGAEFSIQDIPKKGKTGLVLLSQSGETKDLHRCLEIAKDYGLVTIGIVNVVDSMIPRETTCGVYLNAGREVGVASTKSFTSQCVVLALVGIWFSQSKGTCLEKRRKIICDLRNLSWQIDKVLANWDQVTKLGSNLDMGKSCFVLGKGPDEAIARESALKLKEIAYTHAEGFSSSALKHGPFALITPGLPIFILDTNPQTHDKNLNAFQEVKARDARVVLIGSGETCELQTDYSKTFGGVLANIYLQILSFELALKSGTNPDYPRNLAKVVTVE
jgi:glucosamine--fructose-6-phosphate aminotransferase (isomerizing)